MVRCGAVFGGGIVAVVLYRGAAAADYSGGFAVSLVVGWYRQARIKKAFENLKPFSAAEKQRSDPADGSRKLLTPNLRSLMKKTGKIRRLAVSYGKVEKLKNNC